MKAYILYTRDKNSARREVEDAGGKIAQEFTEELFAAQLPDEFNTDRLIFSTTRMPSTLSETSRLAFDAWALREEKSGRHGLAADSRQGLPWDTAGFDAPESLAPVILPDPEGPQISRSSNTPTSLYMTGTVATGVVIVSGENDLKFTDAEIRKVISEVQEGLQFLSTVEPRAKLVFHYDIRVVSVNVTPGSTVGYEAAEAPWRNAALGRMGFSPNSQGSIDYVNQLKRHKKTDWAYVAYFTKYPLRHFAYAIDERVIMHYLNDGWGPDNINTVFAHETCHIFGAADEYGQCTCNSLHGYLSVANGNCRGCTSNFVRCLMERNDLVLCDWTRKQIGWDVRLFHNDNLNKKLT